MHTLTAFLESELDRAASRASASGPAAAAPAESRRIRERHPRSARARRRRRVAAAARRFGVRLRQRRRRARRLAVAAGALSVGGRDDQRAGGRRSVHQPPVSDTYRVRQDLSQNQHVEGLPLGTRRRHRCIRADVSARRRLRLQGRLFRTNFGNLRGLEHPHQVELAVDGERVRLATIGGDDDLAARVREADRNRATRSTRDWRCGCRSRPARTRSRSRSSRTRRWSTRVRLQPFSRSSSDTLDWTGRPHVDR